MIKKNKTTIILTSVMMLLPVAAGLVLWPRLPEKIATHFDLNGVANGWSSKPFTVFILPLFLLGIHLLCAFATANDPKHRNINEKVYRLILWICPVISAFCMIPIYASALGFPLNMGTIAPVLSGFLFLIAGNYLPKSRQNYTVGIKLPWTMADGDNWNRTHRLAGWVWVIGGFLMLGNAFLKLEWLFIAIPLLLAGIPCVYSFVLYQKKNNGQE